MRPLRVMTYNIHGGRGMDGRIDLDRIAAVVASFDPDLLALQEVDVNRTRSGIVDQTSELSRRLGLEVRFGPTIEAGTERYGNATLTRLPVITSYQLCLPSRGSNPPTEPRCALVTRVAWNGVEVDMVNTHLSTHFGERPAQVTELLRRLDSDDIPDAAITIVAGDFNCTPWSRPYRTLRGDDLRAASSPRTWPSALPLFALDHILFRGPVGVVRAGIWRAPHVRRASDHLPVIAELTHATSEVAA